MTQTRIPSLRSMATCLLFALASVSAAPPHPHPPAPPHHQHPPPPPPPHPPRPKHKSPFPALQSVPTTGSSLSPIITGLYANATADTQIIIHDTLSSAPSWTWSAADAATAQSDLPTDLLRCMQSGSAVPEVKWTDDGRSVLAIYNAAALVISHAPGSDKDKQVTFGVCLDQGGDMGNTHSLELVPDGQLAIATTSPSTEATILIFNVSAGLGADPAPVQSLNRLPGVHSLVWDEHGSLLWGFGSTADPGGYSGSSAPALNGYTYTQGGSFSTEPTYSYNVTAAVPLDTEWPAGSPYSGWWDGGHDMAGVPGRRQLLLSTDTDLHVFDIAAATFESGSAVADKYLAGFAAVDSRVGAVDGKALPRSDIKSLSIDGSHNVLYVQAAWEGVTSYQINLLENGQLRPAMTYPQALYRSRWFAATPTWPKARLPSS